MSAAPATRKIRQSGQGNLTTEGSAGSFDLLPSSSVECVECSVYGTMMCVCIYANLKVCGCGRTSPHQAMPRESRQIFRSKKDEFLD